MFTETQWVARAHFADRIIEIQSLWHLGSGFIVNRERPGAAESSYSLVGEAKTYTLLEINQNMGKETFQDKPSVMTEQGKVNSTAQSQTVYVDSQDS